MARLLRTQDYSPRVNAKRFTGPDHPDRDRQFQNIQEWIAIFAELGLPIISVDAKKKELIGNFKNAGAVWCLEPEEVNVYDFLERCRVPGHPLRDLRPALGPGAHLRRHLGGHPGVRRRGDRAVVGPLRLQAVPGGRRVADPGRRRRQQRPSPPAVEVPSAGADRRPLRAARDGLPLPDGGVEVEPGGAPAVRPGEHQLGGPAVAEPGDDAGLGPWDGGRRGGVTASLDRATYPTKVKVPKAEMKRLDLERHEVCPAWNYTISPRRPQLLH